MKKFSEGKWFQYLALPIIVIILYIGLIYLYKLTGLPSSDEIIASVTKYYETYGYWVILIGALAEGALLVNWYLPGSIVVALGVVFAKEAGLSVILMLTLVVVGFFTTALLNYAAGRFGWYHVLLKLGLKNPLEKVQSKVADKGLKILFTTYVHPNFGALAATASGILKLPFKTFALYSFISILAWNSLWTLLFYYFGSALLDNINVMVVFGGILIYFMLLQTFKEKHVDVP